MSEKAHQPNSFQQRLKREAFSLSTCVTLPFALLVIAAMLIILICTIRSCLDALEKTWLETHDVHRSTVYARLEEGTFRIYSMGVTFAKLFGTDARDMSHPLYSSLCGVMREFSMQREVRSIITGDVNSTRCALCGLVNFKNVLNVIGAAETNSNGTYGNLYVVNRDTLEYVEPRVRITSRTNGSNILQTVRDMAFSNTAIFDLVDEYRKGDLVDPEAQIEKLSWNATRPTHHIIHYTNLFRVFNSTYVEKPADDILYIMYISIRVQADTLLNDSSLIDGNGNMKVMALAIPTLGDHDPVIISNNWLQPCVSAPSQFFENNATYLHTSEVSDPLMKAAIPHIKFPLLKKPNSAQQHIFWHHRSPVVVSAWRFVTDVGYPTVLVLVTPIDGIVGMLSIRLNVTVAVVVVVSAALIVSFWFAIEALFTRPLRRIAKALWSRTARKRVPKGGFLRIDEVEEVIDAYNSAMDQLREIDKFVPRPPVGQQAVWRRIAEITADINPLLSSFVDQRGSITPNEMSEVTMTVVYLTIRPKPPVRTAAAVAAAASTSQPQIINAPDTAFETPEALEAFLSLLQRLSANFEGYIYSFTPERAILHFNAMAMQDAYGCAQDTAPASATNTSTHHKTDALSAMRFTLILQRIMEKRAEKGPVPDITYLVDTAVFTCRLACCDHLRFSQFYASGRNASCDIGNVLPAVGVTMGLTEETALLVRDTVRQLPLEVLYVGRDVSTQYPIVLYAAYQGSASDDEWRHAFLEYSTGFYHMLKGEYPRALEVFDELENELGLHDTREEREARGRWELSPSLQGAVHQLQRLMERCRERIIRHDTQPYVRRPFSSSFLHLLRAPLTNRRALMDVAGNHLRDVTGEQMVRSAEAQVKRLHGGAQSIGKSNRKPRDPKAWMHELYVGKVPGRMEAYLCNGISETFTDYTNMTWKVCPGTISSPDKPPCAQVFTLLSPTGTLAVARRLMFRIPVDASEFPSVSASDADFDVETKAMLLDRLRESYQRTIEQTEAGERLIPLGINSPYVLSYLQYSMIITAGVMVVEEYYPGGTIFELFTRYGRRLPAAAIHKYFVSILLGLQYLHSRGLVHGNLNPRTVLVGTEGQCKLSNFFNNYAVAERLLVLRNSCYKSPEVAAGGEPTAASDMYCVGLLMIAAVKCTKPWQWSRKVAMDRSPAQLEVLLEEGGAAFCSALCAGEVEPIPLSTEDVRPHEADAPTDPSFIRLAEQCLVGNPFQRLAVDDAIILLDW